MFVVESRHFLPQHVNLLSHLILVRFHVANIVHRFAKNLPFAGLETAVDRQRVSQFIKKFLHFFATLALGELVGHAELRRTRVWGIALWPSIGVLISWMQVCTVGLRRLGSVDVHLFHVHPHIMIIVLSWV